MSTFATLLYTPRSSTRCSLSNCYLQHTLNKKKETRGREAPERSIYLNTPGTFAKVPKHYLESRFWAPQVKEHEKKPEKKCAFQVKENAPFQGKEMEVRRRARWCGEVRVHPVQ